MQSPYLRLLINGLYALGNCAVGFLTRSWWFVTVGAYYTVLSIARFSVLQIRRRAKGDHDTERFAKRITGWLLVALSVCVLGMNILSAVKDRGADFHEIVMITIAAYTFTKITVSIVGMVKVRRTTSPTMHTLRNVALADAAVSACSMQRSMLVSFPGMGAQGILLLNIATGAAVFLLVLFLGINLIGGERVTMAKSKLSKANEKIAEAVADGYKKMEKGVVEGYKKIEQGVVDGYTKIEDRFVDAYLTKDGETVEQAKERLKRK